jgi:hypothetical protein
MRRLLCLARHLDHLTSPGRAAACPASSPVSEKTRPGATGELIGVSSERLPARIADAGRGDNS